MNVPEKIFEDILTEVVNRFLIPKFNELKMNATGEWINSLEVENNKIRGRKYTEQLVYGRNAGKLPPIAPLEKWVQAKFGYSGSQAKSMAFAVAKKIEKDGTTWKKKGGSDLLEVLETDDVINFINKKLGTYLTTEITLEFQRQLKTT